MTMIKLNQLESYDQIPKLMISHYPGTSITHYYNRQDYKPGSNIDDYNYYQIFFPANEQIKCYIMLSKATTTTTTTTIDYDQIIQQIKKDYKHYIFYSTEDEMINDYISAGSYPEENCFAAYEYFHNHQLFYNTL